MKGSQNKQLLCDCPDLNEVDTFSILNLTTYPKRTQRDYFIAFKLAVVDQVGIGEMTYKKTQKLYAIQGRSTVLVWLRKNGDLDWSLGSTTASLSHLPNKRVNNAEKQLKAHFFERVSDLIKEVYGIEIKTSLLDSLGKMLKC